ncbi:ABC transporter permease [Phytomonospora endophytica]|uniref:Peptide/nickel transport system permease protein/oligopeptide transport system permease protein n=1 Tax=Phytomonospora endophytica TaxID=714109 RepID=A0A841FX75_9ACTN|nr:ABC transporter permease [Phytomonospora endophytica]MBB6036570.1 peptide/nickel transport system permease protein/oligopeptide transport system permease protein [Phytomonospora endophytica]GIG65891.1 peptide ABC transporter permease [Phytomonospora endophytica]
MSDQNALPPADSVVALAEGEAGAGRARSLASDAWRDLRKNPIAIISAVIIVILVLMAVWPSLFTGADPAACDLSRSLQPPSSEAWFGYNLQGCDIYARTIYGAKASLQVGLYSVIGVAVIAIVLGMLAGYYGGWADAVIARVTDIVLGIPLLLGAIVILSSVELDGVWPVVLALALLGWTSPARIVRSSVISAKGQDYVQAARMLGANDKRIMMRHIAPNAMAPVIVVLTIALGSFISVEATLSFLGIGLKGEISWGADIADATGRVRNALGPVLFPSTFLALTVLAFIMLGDAVREAFDPKLR